MELRTNVHGGQIKVPTIEHNYGGVYVRFNIEPTSDTDPDGQTVTGWVYDEWFMTEMEYQLIQQGIMPYGGEWDDALRSIERASLYDHADIRIMRLSTYVSDETLKQAWITYKANVHDTVNQPSYPATVTYPLTPE